MGKDVGIIKPLSWGIVILLVASVFTGAFFSFAGAETTEGSNDSGWMIIDDFEGQPDGSEPDGWVDTSDDDLETKFEIDTSEYYNKNASLYFRGSEFWTQVEAHKSFNSVKPPALTAYYRRNPEKEWREDNQDGHNIVWRTDSGEEVLSAKIVANGYSNNGIGWEFTGANETDGEGGSHDGDVLIAGKTEVWYQINWHNIDWEKGTYNAEVIDTRDDSVIATWNGLEFNKTLGSLSQIHISGKGWTAEGGRVDNIAIGKQESDFQIDIDSYDDQIAEGDQLDVSYTVDNAGEVEDTQEIELKIDDVVKGRVNITLDEGEKYEGGFVWHTEEGDVGEHSVEVSSEDDFDEVTLKVVDPPFFDVDMKDPSKSGEVVEGESVYVSYSVTNIGGTTDTQDIQFNVDGETIEVEENVSLEENEEYEGSFEWKPGLPVSYDLSISSEDDEENLTVDVLEEAYFEVEIDELEVESKQERGVPGLTVIVTLNFSVKNSGEATETQQIELSVRKKNKDKVAFEDSEQVTLSGNESYEGSFTWETSTTENAGWYVFELTSDDDGEQEKTQIPSRGRRRRKRKKRGDHGPSDNIFDQPLETIIKLSEKEY